MSITFYTMKRPFIPLLLLVASTVGAAAQSVVIVDKEGLSHQFATTDIDNISVEFKTVAQSASVTFNTLNVNRTLNSVQITLRALDGTRAFLTLGDMVDNKPDATKGCTTAIKSDASWVTMPDGNEVDVKRGNVTFTEVDNDILFVTDLVLRNGTTFKGQFVLTHDELERLRNE